MISSGRLSDRKIKPKTIEGYCHPDCPLFHFDKETNTDALALDATCFKDAKEVAYYDGFLAHCE